MDPVKYTVMLRMYCIMDMLLLLVFFFWVVLASLH